MIRNSKVTLYDAKRALHIYGEDPALIKGKTVKRKQSKSQYHNIIKLSKHILCEHKEVHLMVDYMFVQGIQFLSTISDGFKQHIKNMFNKFSSYWFIYIYIYIYIYSTIYIHIYNILQ